MKRIITTFFVFALAIGIFAPIVFSVNQNGVQAQTNAVHAQTATHTAESTTYDQIGSCGFGIFDDSSFGNCLVTIFYYIPFWIGGKIMEISAKFLDCTATLTLSSRMFSSAGFLQTGWALMRDIANIFFIIMLLYIAMCIMLGIKVSGISLGHGDPKTLVWWVVLIALLINFSMFFTDFVIDTSNTMALVFYNQISVVSDAPGHLEVTDPDDLALSGQSKTGIQPKSIGAALASGMHPQVLVDPKGTFWTSLKTTGGVATPDATVPATTLFAIVLIVGILYLAVAWSFFLAGFAFMGRMVTLFVLIIFSPIAFVSIIVPNLRKKEHFGWDKWWPELLGISFAAPIYFLLILLLTLLMNSGLFGAAEIAPGTSWVVVIIGSILVPTIILFKLLKFATDEVQEASGEIGQWLSEKAGTGAKVVGAFAGGTTLGAAKAVSRTADGMSGGRIGNAIGGAASAIGNAKNTITQKYNSFVNGSWTARTMGQGGGGGAPAQGGAAPNNKSTPLANIPNIASLSGGTQTQNAGTKAGTSTTTATGTPAKTSMFAQAPLAQPKISLSSLGLKKKEGEAVATEKTKRENAIKQQEGTVSGAQTKADNAKKDVKNAKENLKGAENDVSKIKENLKKNDEDEKKAKADLALGAATENPLKIAEATKKLSDIEKAKEEGKQNLKNAEQNVAQKKTDLSAAKSVEHKAKNELRDEKAVLSGLQTGNFVQKNADGKVMRTAAGMPKTEPKLTYGTDPKTNQPYINPSTGQPVTKAEAVSTMSITELKMAPQNAKSSPVKEQIAAKIVESSGGKKEVKMQRDPLSSVTTVNANSKPLVRSWGGEYMQATQGTFAKAPLAQQQGTPNITIGTQPTVNVTVIPPNATETKVSTKVERITNFFKNSEHSNKEEGTKVSLSGEDKDILKEIGHAASKKSGGASSTIKNVNTTTKNTVNTTTNSAGGDIAEAFGKIVGDMKNNSTPAGGTPDNFGANIANMGKK